MFAGIDFSRHLHYLPEVPAEWGPEMQELAQESPAHSVTFSPDGKIIASASGSDLFLWDAVTGEEIEGFEHDCAILAAGFSPDGRFIAMITSEGVHLWDTLRDKELKLVLDEKITAAAFSPDGKTLASS